MMRGCPPSLFLLRQTPPMGSQSWLSPDSGIVIVVSNQNGDCNDGDDDNYQCLEDEKLLLGHT